MTRGDESRAHLEELRRRAERELLEREAQASSTGASAADLPSLVQELQVHQCELEIQNEELRCTQAELEEARDRYFELFDLAPITYLTVGRDCTIEEANLAAAELLGCDRDELLRRRLPAFVDEEDVHRFHLFWNRVFESGTRQACTVSITVRGRRAVPVHLEGLAVASARDGPLRARVVAIDLSEITEARTALFESRGRFRSVFESTGGGIVVFDAGGRAIEANAAVCEVLGYEQEELCRLTIEDLTHPNDREESLGELERTRREPGGSIDMETRWVRKDGVVVWGHVTASWVFDGVGAPLYAVALIHDITSRKAAEASLRAQQAELKGIVDTSADAVVTADEAGQIRSINRRGEELFGYSADELRGQNVQILMPSPYREEHDGYMARYLTTGEAGIIGVGREVAAIRKDGTAFPVHLALSELNLEDERLFCAFVRDLTQAKRFEEQLHLAQRMEAVGTLASGVAHDFNNLLTGVSGCANLALDRLEPGHPARLYLKEIRDSVGGGAETVRQLVSYSRRSQGEAATATSVDLNAVVTRSRGLIEPLLGEGIALTLDLTAEESRALADAARLEQILLNLASNARDAMPEGGNLRIETRRRRVREGERGLPAGEYVALAIADTGTGIDPSVRKRIFDPFFTTKPESEGSGLGLFSCYGIVQGWGGSIDVSSAPGRGTRFEILLHSVHEPAASEVEEIAQPDEAPSAGETVLLVEDDRLVRITTRCFLEDAGYEVLEASRGDGAVERARSHPGTIAVVLTDVTLPGYHGARVAREIQALRGGAAVVFMSAHPRDVLVAEGKLEGEALLLLKPFSKEELLAQVAHALGKTPARGYRTLR
jgi:PAS domain S-box-containing protein